MAPNDRILAGRLKVRILGADLPTRCLPPPARAGVAGEQRVQTVAPGL